MISKYGKKNIRDIKKMFVENNDEMVLRDTRIFGKIKTLGLFERCLVCKTEFQDISFKKHNLNYYSCQNCGCLGIGTPKNFDKFFELLYGDHLYGDYSKLSNARIQNIYIPKVDFLSEVLPNINDLGVIDIGCGMGYFVAALNQSNIKSFGYEVNENFVKYANKNLQLNNIFHKHPDDILKSQNHGHKVASMIGVLEHLPDPVKAISSLIEGGYEYLYISVPMIGLSSYIEAISDTFYHRHLSPDHLYAYSEKTLLWIEEKLFLERVGQWYFGTDADDLFRLISNNTNPRSSLDYDLWLDDIQQIIDKNKMSSEIHLVWKLPN